MLFDTILHCDRTQETKKKNEYFVTLLLIEERIIYIRDFKFNS